VELYAPEADADGTLQSSRSRTTRGVCTGILGGDADKLPPHSSPRSTFRPRRMRRWSLPLRRTWTPASPRPSTFPRTTLRRLPGPLHDRLEIGLKGLATYRPNKVIGSVLSVDSTATAAAIAPQDFVSDDRNRRIQIKAIPQPVLRRSAGRAVRASKAVTWRGATWSSHAHGTFCLFVGEYQNGTTRPFEVWVNGAEQPRGLAALAKTLSMDMRANDPAWMRLKLDTLAKTSGDDAFEMPFPPNGERKRMPSVSAAVAQLVRFRYEQLKVLPEGSSGPVIDSMFSLKEPKTGTDGTMSWTVDVLNPSTGDDFVLGLKEITLPDGITRPYSVWLSGDYPRALDGLCKTLSLDMRVIDPAWIGMKLRKLLVCPSRSATSWRSRRHAQAAELAVNGFVCRAADHPSLRDARHPRRGRLSDAGDGHSRNAGARHAPRRQGDEVRRVRQLRGDPQGRVRLSVRRAGWVGVCGLSLRCGAPSGGTSAPTRQLEAGCGLVRIER
jgi:hypothetical protein